MSAFYDLFIPSLPAWNLLVRAVIVYLAILLLLRIGGKRQMGQMGATEFVALLLISNAVQNSMNGGDNSLGGGLILAAILIATSVTISYVTYRSRNLSRLFEGTPTLLVRNGKLLDKNLARERMTKSELTIKLREQGVHDLKQIAFAILEPDGSLSVTHTSDSPAPVPI